MIGRMGELSGIRCEKIKRFLEIVRQTDGGGDLTGATRAYKKQARLRRVCVHTCANLEL